MTEKEAWARLSPHEHLCPQIGDLRTDFTASMRKKVQDAMKAMGRKYSPIMLATSMSTDFIGSEYFSLIRARFIARMIHECEL